MNGYRTQCSRTRRHIPQQGTHFELTYGYQAEIPTALTKPPKPTYNYDDYAQKLKERLRLTTQFVKERVKEEKAKVK